MPTIAEIQAANAAEKEAEEKVAAAAAAKPAVKAAAKVEAAEEDGRLGKEAFDPVNPLAVELAGGGGRHPFREFALQRPDAGAHGAFARRTRRLSARPAIVAVESALHVHVSAPCPFPQTT